MHATLQWCSDGDCDGYGGGGGSSGGASSGNGGGMMVLILHSRSDPENMSHLVQNNVGCSKRINQGGTEGVNHEVKIAVTMET